MKPSEQILQDIINLLPHLQSEMWLGLLFLILIVTDLIFPKKYVGGLFLFGLGVNLALVGKSDLTELAVSGLEYAPRAGKVLLSIAGMLTVLIEWVFPNRNKRKKNEFWVVLVAILLGLQLMLMASSWLMLYLSIELVSISSYILTAFKFSKKSAEGALTYLIFGAFSSAVMLYGVSFLYGLSGTLEIAESLQSAWVAQSLLGGIAVVLALAGLLFKIAAVPLHVWSPDLYEAAPTAAVAFFSVAPKVAGVLVLHKMMQIAGLPQVMLPLLAVVSIASILFGNLAALRQKRFKRLLAYSSIAHAGFLLVAVLASTYQNLIFFLAIYLLMNFFSFGLAQFIENEEAREDGEIQDVFKKLPVFLGVATLLVAVSFVGLPITAGFTAKLFIFSDLWQLYAQSGEKLILWLFVIGLGNAVVSLFYYLKLPFFALIKREGNVYPIGLAQKIFFAVFSILLVLFFFKPDWVLIWI